MVAVEGADNPFNGVDVGGYAAPTFVDVDSDGDMDAFVGKNDGTYPNYVGKILHFKNTGSVTNPTFVEQTGTSNPFNGVDVDINAAPIFVDTDGDLDVLIGNSEGFLRYFALTRCTPPSEHHNVLDVENASFLSSLPPPLRSLPVVNVAWTLVLLAHSVSRVSRERSSSLTSTILPRLHLCPAKAVLLDTGVTPLGTQPLQRAKFVNQVANG